MKFRLQLLLLLNAFIAAGQDYSYRGYVYKWEALAPKETPVDSAFRNFHAVVLSEQLEISFSRSCEFNWDLNPQFLRDLPGEVTFRKKAVVKVLDETGAKAFSSFSLPESVDPEFDRMTVPYQQQYDKLRPTLLDIRVKYFAARVFAQNNTTKGIKPKDKLQIREVFINDQFINEFSYSFVLEGVKEGDLLEYTYEYTVPFCVYYLTSSGRYFFNSEFPKQISTLKLSFPAERILFYKFNGAKADFVNGNGSNKEVIFIDTSLAGYGKQKGVRMNKDLPYIGFYYYLGLSDVISPYGQDSGKGPFFTPVQVISSLGRRTNAMYQSVYKTPSKNKLDKFYLQVTNGIPDSLPKKKLLAIHKEIADNFSYVSQIERHRNYDVFNDHGDMVEKKALYENHENAIYEELIGRTGYNDLYYAGFLDKRVETFYPEIWFPPIYSRHGYGIPVGNNFVNLYPKRCKTGYKVNEFPFYFEDAVSYYYKSVYDPKTDKSKISFRIKLCPYSDENSNIRTYNAVFRCSFDTLKLNAEGRLSLSGQFSTLTRGLYLNNETDSTLNSFYKRKIWNFRKGVKLLKQEVTSKGDEFPFRHGFKFRYQSDNLLVKTSDKTYELDLSGLFVHIIHEGFSARERSLKYYPDFTFQDVIHYQFFFDKDFVIAGKEQYETEIKVGKGSYKLKITQPSPGILDIESYLLIADPVFEVVQAAEIEKCYQAITKLNTGKLQLKLLN